MEHLLKSFKAQGNKNESLANSQNSIINDVIADTSHLWIFTGVVSFSK